MNKIPKTYRKVNNNDIDCDICLVNKARSVSLYDDELSEQHSRYYCLECLLTEERYDLQLSQLKKEFNKWLKGFTNFLEEIYFMKEMEGTVERI